MKVQIDTTPLYTSRAGVARYVRGLLHGLSRVTPAGVQVEELGWPVENLGYAQPARALITLAREWGWAKLVAPMRARHADVLHHTALPTISFLRRPRHVVTLHDLALLRDPRRFRPWQRRSGLRRLHRVAQADRVVCVSRFTADEAIALLGLPARRLEVVHEGGWLPSTAPDSADLLPVLPDEFFLFVGSLEPGKNLALLREIYLSPTQSPLPPLLIVGTRWAGVPHEGSAPSAWRFLGHVSDSILAQLYRAARALLFPSRYEGFGLPIVEAMACGCPVVCGRVASLPEIGGEAVCYAGLTPNEFGTAMRRLLKESSLVAQLRAAGEERARAFSWEKCARETLAIYADVTSA